MRAIQTVALVGLAIFFAAFGIGHAGAAEGRLEIYWIDVEGGAATLIVTPAEQSVLIDSGNPGFRDADRIVKTATKEAGLRKIDFLITTHYHGDHFGGAATLSGLMPIGVVYDNGVFENMPDNPGKEYFSFKCDERVVIQPGDKLPLAQREGSPAIELICLAARQSFVSPEQVGATANEEIGKKHRPKERDGSDNANSIVMRLSLGQFRFFDAGDLTWNQEARLVHPFDLVGPVDVYQVTHHGLDSSNNPAVLETLRPTVAIMNNGPTKGCLPEVFANLKETKSLKALYQGHKNVRPDGAVNNAPDEFIANRTEPCEANIIKLSVAPGGETYTVSIPANKHEATYETTAKTH
jgi:hypothetical protein